MVLNKEFIYSISDCDRIVSEVKDSFPDFVLFALRGELGAGKTTFVQSFCRILGSVETVSSPTFSIVNEYHYNENKSQIYHFDLYRLNTLEEILDTGFEEYLYSGSYCFIEWPEKVTNILPLDLVVSCEFQYLGIEKRKLICSIV
ncbi:MAG: tRNA (adenosine(37)-N6)-threonylcarbamoyltransferase complex ATPase subunit type 1 TsaE [Flavobacteriales bacterium]|nr:tRNA (adenosine(37)-N6)-threonylcarbamoyltransferase complex ATPase subunit type 1 TsaE [Flavobacteriales bacterium]